MDTIAQGTPIALVVSDASQNPSVSKFPEGTKGTFLRHIMDGDIVTDQCAINIGGNEYVVFLEDIKVVDIHENDWVLVEKALSEIQDGDSATIFMVIQDMKEKKLLPEFFRRLITRGQASAAIIMSRYTNDPVMKEFFLAAEEVLSQDCE